MTPSCSLSTRLQRVFKLRFHRHQRPLPSTATECELRMCISSDYSHDTIVDDHQPRHQHQHRHNDAGDGAGADAEDPSVMRRPQMDNRFSPSSSSCFVTDQHHETLMVIVENPDGQDDGHVRLLPSASPRTTTLPARGDLEDRVVVCTDEDKEESQPAMWMIEDPLILKYLSYQSHVLSTSTRPRHVDPLYRTDGGRPHSPYASTSTPGTTVDYVSGFVSSKLDSGQPGHRSSSPVTFTISSSTLPSPPVPHGTVPSPPVPYGTVPSPVPPCGTVPSPVPPCGVQRRARYGAQLILRRQTNTFQQQRMTRHRVQSQPPSS